MCTQIFLKQSSLHLLLRLWQEVFHSDASKRLSLRAHLHQPSTSEATTRHSCRAFADNPARKQSTTTAQCVKKQKRTVVSKVSSSKM
jgi:hypothetical protein